MRNDLSFATIETLQSLLRAREVSSAELTAHFLDRLERIGPSYNALASLTRDRALAEAANADAARRRGADSPLLGVPYGVKDALAAIGAPTTYGSGAFANQYLDHDATAIARLARAGSVLVGKLALLELLGFGAWTNDASYFGSGITPWKSGHSASGSSSGSGAAVAAGLVPFALGSETGGSIAGPSAFCGVTGIRPTYGLVSRSGALPMSWTIDKIGPMAHSAWDCAVVLEAIAGPDSKDRSTARTCEAASVEHARRTLRSVRLGYASADFDDLADATIRPALATALGDLTGLGFELFEAELPALPYHAAYYLISSAEGGAALGPLIQSEAISKVTSREQIAYLRGSLEITAVDYINAMRVRTQVRQAFTRIFDSVDALVSFTQAGPPPPVAVDFHAEDETRGNAALIVAANLAGLPGLFLPCGFTSDGLPVGIQLVGPAFSEAMLVAIGQAFQEATRWHEARPPVEGGWAGDLG
jgi:aspartyl-tRNA(Asn)/glutamyl-tRNA(Gln) amidotransferase subunit A